MIRFRSAFVVLLLVAMRSAAAEPPPLATAYGRVVKANANVVLVRPATSGGKLGDAIALKLTGTSRATVVTLEKRADHPAAVQRDIKPKDLQPDQIIAVIYTVIDQDKVLLTAVVHPHEGR